MKKSYYTETQIIAKLKDVDAGRKVENAGPDHGFSKR